MPTQKITVYTMHRCPYCEAAKKLLSQEGYAYEEKLVEMDDDATWTRLEKETGYKTMPQIFIGSKFIGGYNDLAALKEKGELAILVET